MVSRGKALDVVQGELRGKVLPMHGLTRLCRGLRTIACVRKFTRLQNQTFFIRELSIAENRTFDGSYGCFGIGADTVSSLTFGKIERLIGLVKKGFVCAGWLKLGDAHRDRDAELLVAPSKLRGCDGFANALGSDERASEWCSRQDEEKLLTAIADEHVDFTDLVLRESDDLFENEISGKMSIGIVEAFEEIDVREDDAEGCLVPSNAFDFLREVLEEELAVVGMR